ncbi:MAG: DUF1786 domain-containing protein [Desulfovibrio sp.]|nr:DUF1786 domain-containing protein [Desulfovibrio sp.]
MNETIYAYLEKTGPVFCLDIGSGTQDGLLALPGVNFDNWPRFILPSPARRILCRIEKATQAKQAIWLYGGNMGGGFTQAVLKHLSAGLACFATQEAAKAICDNPQKVQKMGIVFAEHCPAQALPLHLSDFSPEFWQTFLTSLDLPMPAITVAAAQDHGFCLSGNRTFRMQIWNDLLSQHNRLPDWIYHEVPSPLTRLAALQAATGGPVADTGTSALLAFLCDSGILKRSFATGITLVNAGNTHTLAALIFQGNVCGLYEQHTGLLDKAKLDADLHDFRLGWLPCEQVQKAMGHGTVYGTRPEEAGGFEPTYFTGPRREQFAGLGQFINPLGDMMVAGCFGLLYGLSLAANPPTNLTDNSHAHGCL